MGGASAGQRLCFQVAPLGAISHQRELKLAVASSLARSEIPLGAISHQRELKL